MIIYKSRLNSGVSMSEKLSHSNKADRKTLKVNGDPDYWHSLFFCGPRTNPFDKHGSINPEPPELPRQSEDVSGVNDVRIS